jgi:hypothetical protein
MSIKWYRGAGKRVLTPRRDKPKGPKPLRHKKQKKLGKPKKPGVSKPHVKVPFIAKAKLAHGGKNTSVAGLNAVMRIARENKMVIDEIVWITSQSDVSGGGHECRVVNESSGAGICDVLGAGNGWRGPDAMSQFQSSAAMSYPMTRGYGIWALSHNNCKSSVRMVMSGPNGRAAFIVNAQTDPSEPKKSDMAGGSAEESIITNIESGYSYDPTPGISTIPQSNIKQLSPEMLNMYRSFHTGDQAEVEKFMLENDQFGRDIYGDDIRADVAAEPLAPAVTAPEEIPQDIGEDVVPTDVRKQLEEVRKRIEEQEKARREEEAAKANLPPPPGPLAPGV